MRQCRCGVRDRHPGHRRGEHHIGKVGGVRGLLFSEDRQAPCPHPETGVDAHSAEIRRVGVQKALYEVGQRVKCRVREYGERSAGEIASVDQSEIRKDLVCDGLFDHFIPVGDDRDRRDLRPGPTGRRDCDDRERLPGTVRSVKVTFVLIGHRDHERDCL